MLCDARHQLARGGSLQFSQRHEHKQQMSRVVNSKLAMRLLGNLSQRTNAALSMEAPALWKKASSSHWFCFFTYVGRFRSCSWEGRKRSRKEEEEGRAEGRCQCTSPKLMGSFGEQILPILACVLETLVDQRLSSRRLPRRVLGRSVESLSAVNIPTFESIITSKISPRSTLQPLVAR